MAQLREAPEIELEDIDGEEILSAAESTPGTGLFALKLATFKAWCLATVRSLPAGGVEGQVVTKGAGDAVAWADATGGGGSGVPAGGTTGQVLGKLSDDDGDADWIDVEAATGGATGGAGEHPYWRLLIVPQAAEYANLSELVLTDTLGGAQKATGGTVIASGTYAGAAAANAFDGVPTTYWESQKYGPYWIGYQFAAPIQIVEARVTVQDYYNNEHPAPGSVMQFSDDGATWTTAFNVDPTWGQSGGVNTETFVDPTYVPAYNSKVPLGGETGQILAKASEDDGDTIWIDPPTGGGGGGGGGGTPVQIAARGWRARFLSIAHNGGVEEQQVVDVKFANAAGVNLCPAGSGTPIISGGSYEADVFQNGGGFWRSWNIKGGRGIGEWVGFIANDPIAPERFAIRSYYDNGIGHEVQVEYNLTGTSGWVVHSTYSAQWPDRNNGNAFQVIPAI